MKLLNLMLMVTTSWLALGSDVAWETFEFKTQDEQTTQAERGFIEVKERRDNPDSRLIKLGFVRFKSTSENPGSPIVYLAGGPGGSGVGTAKGKRFGLFMKMRGAADVIAYDQRGTGSSTRIPNCQKYWSYPNDEPMNRKKLHQLQEDNARACAAWWKEQGVDLNGYNTIESAHDLDDLRRALGVEKISIWGISYGTHLGIAYAKYYPEYVDRLILAGLEGPDHTIKRPRDTQRLLETIDALAKAQGVEPPLLETMKMVLNRLEKKPQQIKAINSYTGGEIPLTIGKFDVQLATSGYMRGPSSFKVLPMMYKEMAAGDFSSIAPTILSMRNGGIRGMSAAMDSASYASTIRLAEIKQEEQNTLLEGAINFLPNSRLAGALGVNDLGDAFRAPLKSDVPALLISGTYDGRTVVNNAVEILEGLPNGRHLIIEGAGHSNPLFLSSPKIGETMLAFMLGKPVEDMRITLPPMSFDVRESISLSETELATYAGAYKMADGGAVDITSADGRLVVKVAGMGVFNFHPSSKTEFFMKDSPAILKFELNGGKVAQFEVNYQGDIMKGAPVE